MSNLLAAVAAIAVGLHAGDGPPSENPLAGPTVETAAPEEERSLVRKGFNGTVAILPVEVDVAAIELLDLTETQRREFERLKSERSILFGRAVRENLDLLMQFSGLNPKDHPAEFFDLMTRLGEALSEYRARGTMMREMTPHLDTAQMREVRRLVAEYVQARAAAIRRESGEDTPAGAIAIRIQFETLGEMAKASIEGAIAMGSAVFEELAQRLQLTPDQRAKIERIFEPIAIQELQGKQVAPIVKVRAFFQISHLLTKEQMAALAEYTREEKEAARAETGVDSDRMEQDADR